MGGGGLMTYSKFKIFYLKKNKKVGDHCVRLLVLNLSMQRKNREVNLTCNKKALEFT